MIRPTPGTTARRSSRERLVVAVEADPGRVEAGALGDGELAAGADVEAEALLGDPAGDRRCRGTPCRRSRRPSRQSAKASRKARARPRKSASSRTYAGVLTLGDQVGDRALRRRGARRRPCGRSSDHRCGTRALGSSGSRSQAGPAEGPVGVRPARRVRGGHRLHPLRGGDAEQAEAVGEDGAGGDDQHQPGLVDRPDRLVALRQHPALLGVVPLVEHRRSVSSR